jgi:hypothetical protein
VDARRALDAVEMLKGRSVDQALRLSDVVRPGRSVERARLETTIAEMDAQG